MLLRSPLVNVSQKKTRQKYSLTPIPRDFSKCQVAEFSSFQPLVVKRFRHHGAVTAVDRSHSLVPMVLLPLCPHHFLNILILWNPFDHSWTWESGRQNHMWGTFSSAFHIPSIHTIQSTVSRTCASGVLIYNYTLWYPFPSSESFFTSSSSLIPS